MTIIVFLIDTSASMNQRSYIGPSFLDLAKGAVDTFLKFRARDPAARGADRYMLMTFEEPPRHIKAGFRENQLKFMEELRNLKATGITTMANALGNTLHYLNCNRLQSGIDNFGSGRYPHWLEPAAIIVISDGGCMAQPNGTVKQTIEIPTSQFPGSEMTVEPFRWDHRIFALVLRLAGHPPKAASSASLALVPQDASPVDSICEATGGRSYSVTTQKMINQCLESLVQKIQSGGVVYFEKYGPDPPPPGGQNDDRPKSIPLENGFIHQNSKLSTPPNNHITSNNNNNMETSMEISPSSRPSSPSPPPAEPPWTKTRRMIYVGRGMGSRTFNTSHWTLPEAFWADHTMNTLPPRSAHPIIRFKCEPQEPVFPQDLPYDKYELEPSPLTQYILERKQPNVCWYCYVVGSNGKSGDLGAPFGYIKASSAMNGVTLTVLAYNFPVLLPLLEEIKSLKGKATTQWRTKFDKYLKGVPPYYVSSLRSALQKINLAHLLNDASDKHLSVAVVSHLGKVKLRAKEELDRLNAGIGQPLPPPEGIRVIPRSSFSSLLASNKLLSMDRNQLKIDGNEFSGFRIHVASNSDAVGGLRKTPTINGQTQMSFRNPFDIQRDQLLIQIAKMRVNLKQSLCTGSTPQLIGAKPGMKYRLQDVEELHQLPIGVMGNYQDYLRAMTPPLREIDATPARLHAFGNPFKVDKKMLVDEADIDNLVGSATTAATGGSGQGTTGRSHSKRGNLDGPNSSRHYGSPSALHLPSRKRERKPGPLPKGYRWKRSRSGSVTDDDDRSTISGPLSPAMSDISIISDTSDSVEDDRPPGSLRRQLTPLVLTMAHMGVSGDNLIIDENNTERSPEIIQDEVMIIDEQRPSSSNDIDSTPTGTTDLVRRSSSGGENGIEISPTKKKTVKIKMSADDWVGLKRQISALIRKPSQDYGSLWEKIERLPKSMDHGLYEWALSEAERFRRIDLCERLRTRIMELKRPIQRQQSQSKR